MKVLLLDTAFASAPIYEYLILAGHEVWVMGNRPQDLLARLAGRRWIDCNYGNIEEVQSHLNTGNFDSVVPGCTDVSFAICSRLGIMNQRIDSPAVTQLLSDKSAFRDVCSKLSIKSPQMVEIERFPLEGKFICKPVDAYSGRGCTVFSGLSMQELEEATAVARAASPTGRYLIETFVEGPLHSCTGFLEAGRLLDTHYVLEGSSINPFAVDTSYVVENLSASIRAELELSLNTLARKLQLRDGLLHTQFILCDHGAYIIEVSRRCPGDLYPLLIEFSTGYPYAARYASFFVGGKVKATRSRQTSMLRHTIAAQSDQIFGGLHFLESVELFAYYPILPMGGDLVGKQKSRAGILFCRAPDHAHLQQLYDTFLNRSTYSLEYSRPLH